jgi:predicted enzyme related to lactoylglutathione lyase
MADDIITGTDFVSIPAADFDAGVAFYGETLGLRRSNYLPERGFAEFETGTLTLAVFRPDAIGMDADATACPIALHVDDVEAARERLASAGVGFDGETRDTGVCHMAFLHDPQGNPLMLHHRYAPRD